MLGEKKKKRITHTPQPWRAAAAATTKSVKRRVIKYRLTHYMINVYIE